MLVISKNNIILDRLNNDDLEFLEDLDDEAFIEIVEGDESLQFQLGEAWTISELISFEEGDRLVSSYADESQIPFRYMKKPGYYTGEFIYECVGNEENNE